jgi:hypothetical protein
LIEARLNAYQIDTEDGRSISGISFKAMGLTAVPHGAPVARAQALGFDEAYRRSWGYEEDAVHQLLRRHWLTTGATHAVTCGAASPTGVALLVPKQTRDAVVRWERRPRPPSWPCQQGTTTTTDFVRPDLDHRAGWVVRLDDHRRRRR